MITARNENKRILLISNSTVYGQDYLDHVELEIKDFLGETSKVLFIPFALYDRDTYAATARKRFASMGYELKSVHQTSNLEHAISEADAVFIGGGNTFRLLKCLYDFNLLDSIRSRVNEGTPFIGSSAGSIVAGPSLKTTKDMPVVEPPSFDALNIVPFQISPHFLDPDPTSTHMGETQEERINQFLEENEAPVVGLREGAFLRVSETSVLLKGTAGARIFRKGLQPVETSPGDNLFDLISTI
jgi:dipeptidase E